MKNVKSIIILGGGSAGWMTASTLIKEFPDKEITVIESPNTPIIGVGESTIGGIKYWSTYLGIDDTEFFKYTDATYKLSIRFDHFWKKHEKHGINYVFGPPNLGEFTLNDWWYKKYLKEKGLIQVDSNAPEDVLRTIYTNSKLSGDIENSNGDMLINNYMNDKELNDEK